MVVGLPPVGMACAFSSSLRGLKLVPSKRRYLVPPTSGYPAENVRGRPQAVRHLPWRFLHGNEKKGIYELGEANVQFTIVLLADLY
jgi:hypothetical protein